MALAALALVAGLGGCATSGPAAMGGVAPAAGAADQLGTRVLMVPVAGVWPQQVPDTFDAQRDGGRRHEASDIPAPRATPVLSADDGRVLRVGVNRRGGNMIYACDPSGSLIYYYAHLEAFAPGLQAGRPLRRGEVIGSVGTSGNAPKNAPHLHFQLMLRRADGVMYGSPAVDARPLFALPGVPADAAVAPGGPAPLVSERDEGPRAAVAEAAAAGPSP